MIYICIVHYIIYSIYLITMQFATDGSSSLYFTNAFKIDSVPSLSRALEWQKDLDHVYAISNISVSMTKVCNEVLLLFSNHLK